MKFIIVPEHRDFFAKNKYIEFENLLSAKEAVFFQEISQTKRGARDIWRDDRQAKKNHLFSRFGELAASLFKTAPLRLAYDQCFAAADLTNATLEEISFIRPITGGLIVKNTNVILFRRDLVITPDFLPENDFYLLAFCPARAQYVLEDRDPHKHALKKLGYYFGDALKDTTHPILFR